MLVLASPDDCLHPRGITYAIRHTCMSEIVSRRGTLVWLMIQMCIDHLASSSVSGLLGQGNGVESYFLGSDGELLLELLFRLLAKFWGHTCGLFALRMHVLGLGMEETDSQDQQTCGWTNKLCWGGTTQPDARTKI